MKTIFIIAAIFAVFGYSCCVVAGEEDERMECMEKQYHVRQGKSD